MSQSSISYLWREPEAAKSFTTGVSLHSHTNQSQETLDFIAELSKNWGILQPLMRWCEDRCQRLAGIRPDYAHSYWTPPLTPSLAFDLERSQIEDRLQMPGLVSLTDHDDIQAPMLLRSVPSSRHIPVSVEWTVPFGQTAFHLGIHNLPSATAAKWMERLKAFTAIPVETRQPNLLKETLAELDELPGVLIVFNHPIWDLYRIGNERHNVLVNEFLAVNGQYVHALELNGLRDWKENRQVSDLARKWNQLVISGGDRHGIEPNANINLTRAGSFTEFVHEVRRERQSHVLFMPQYAEPWKHRILQSTLDAIRDYPHFPEGSRRWDQRVYHPDSRGVMRPLSELWTTGHAPLYLRSVLSAVRLMGQAPLSGGLRIAWNDAGEMRAALAKLDA
ncbi:PHP domain-containing protein [Edaphobacter dinghuensis]|uniref:Uncharacterized protein n=1 Tax=Edaphobacter dinghuensis TaxID=1560005 RepID=A0A917GZ13_9BACT|nr:hypothetical protein [Edaphobacter dinghuensis]GGG62661.1 hypothetical protein GCM10011585_00080 [Edaphobacter dinghuensis]